MWNTPKTWAAGEIPTFGRFNLELRDNVNHLKGRCDMISKMVETEPEREVGTVYRNSVTIRIMSVTLKGVANSLDYTINGSVYTGQTEEMLELQNFVSGKWRQATNYLHMLFIIPPYYYYKVATTEEGGTASIMYWYEYNLHNLQG